MKNLIFRLYQFLHNILLKNSPSWFCFLLYYVEIEITTLLKYKKLKKFHPDIKLLDNYRENIICFSQHPYTNKILKNGIGLKKDKFNLITFGRVFSIYQNLVKGDRDASFNLDGGVLWDLGNYDCYEKLGRYYMENNPKFFNEHLIGSCDFSLPTQLFKGLNRNIIYLNHRFPYLGYFNVFKVSDWKKKINNLKQENNILVAADNFDYEYHKYVLGDKKIYFIPPLLDTIDDKYKGTNNKFLIVPGKDRFFKQREEIIDLCINQLGTKGFTNIFSITREYKNKRYEFGEIAKYKALIVIPYTIYIGSIMDFLEMGMPMFFPSTKLLAKWHKELNILAEYDFVSQYTEYCGKNIFGKKFIKKIENLFGEKNGIPSPYSDDIKAIEYWIGKSDWYTSRPIITFDSFGDLADKLKSIDMNLYSKTLLEFNESQKKKSKKNWNTLLSDITIA